MQTLKFVHSQNFDLYKIILKNQSQNQLSIYLLIVLLNNNIQV